MKIFSRSIKLDQCVCCVWTHAFLVCKLFSAFAWKKIKWNALAFFLTSANDKHILTNKKWALKNLTKIKVDNFIEGEKEFTEQVGSFTEIPKRFSSILHRKKTQLKYYVIKEM
jgi:hypothetical protein